MKKMLFSPFRSRALMLAVLVVLVTFTTSCDKEADDAPAQPKTAADIFVEGSDFTILEAAIRQAGQLDAFKNPNLTVFAPNDAAFRASGIADASGLVALTNQQLTAILQYHVLKAAVAASGFPMEKNKPVQTSLSINNQPVVAYVTNSSAGLYVNGAKVVTPDVQAANGVIHVIDHILLPPPSGGGGSLVGVVQADTSLSLLGVAALRVAAVNPTLAGVLTGTEPYTAFAPTNSAFRALKLSTADTINKVPVAALTAILANHVVAGRLYSNNLTTGDVTAFGTGKLAVNVGSGSTVTVKSNGISSPATVTRANVTATNGVVHKIDKVLVM